jgi:hypothetical protein
MTTTFIPDLPEPETPTLTGMLDLVLHGQAELDRHLTEPHRLLGLTERLLALSVIGLVIHGAVVAMVAAALGDTSLTAAIAVPAALAVAFLAALAICLPSFWFYTQIAGLDASFRLITVQALRVQGTTSALLLGALPILAAVALGTRLGVGPEPETVVLIGLAMPFVVGLRGLLLLRRSFTTLVEVLPRNHLRRGGFIRRLTLAWGAVYTAVAPVALWRALELFDPAIAEVLRRAIGG